MRRDQAQREGPQEFGLSRARRSNTQTVRSHSVVSGFLEVELDGCAVRRDADRYPQSVVRSAPPPRRFRPDGGGIVNAEQLRPITAGLRHALVRRPVRREPTRA